MSRIAMESVSSNMWVRGLNSLSNGNIGGIFDASPALPPTARQSWAIIIALFSINVAVAIALCVFFEVARRTSWFRVSVFYSRKRHLPQYTPPPLMSGRGVGRCCRHPDDNVQGRRFGLFEWLFLGTDRGYTQYAEYEDRMRRKRKHQRRMSHVTRETFRGFTDFTTKLSQFRLASFIANDVADWNERFNGYDFEPDDSLSSSGDERFYDNRHQDPNQFLIDLDEEQHQHLTTKPDNSNQQSSHDNHPDNPDNPDNQIQRGITPSASTDTSFRTATQSDGRNSVNLTVNNNNNNNRASQKQPWRRSSIDEESATSQSHKDDSTSVHSLHNQSHASAESVDSTSHPSSSRHQHSSSSSSDDESEDEENGERSFRLAKQQNQQQRQSFPPPEESPLPRHHPHPSNRPPPAPFRLPYMGIRKSETLDTLMHRVIRKRPPVPPPNTLTRTSADSKNSNSHPDAHVVETKEYGRRHPDYHLMQAQARANRMRPLSASDRALLEQIGLDMFVMIRILRFGFDISFYPFLVTGAVLIPIYLTSGCGDLCGAHGYYKASTANLEPGSKRYWATLGVMLAYLFWFLYRWRVEWETFFSPRLEYLRYGGAVRNTNKEGGGRGRGSAGSAGAFGSSSGTGGGGGRGRRGSGMDKRGGNGSDSEAENQNLVGAFQRTVLVEHIPRQYRCNRHLYEFFDELFPNQVRRAEVLLKTERLKNLISKRQDIIEKIENTVAHKSHKLFRHQRKLNRYELSEGEASWLCCCFQFSWEKKKPLKPEEPTMRIGPWWGKRRVVQALPYLRQELDKYNELVDQEYQAVVEQKRRIENGGGEQRSLSYANGCWEFIMYFVRGADEGLYSTAGFVEFKTLAATKSAVALGPLMTGMVDFLKVSPAGDPRDIIWSNISMKQKFIKAKKIMTFCLFTVLLVPYVMIILNFSALLHAHNDTFTEYTTVLEGTFIGNFVQQRAPFYTVVILMELVMFLIRVSVRLFANSFVKMKTHGEVDKFVFVWSFLYRLTTFVILFFGPSAFNVRSETYWADLSTAVIKQSPVFIGFCLNNGFLQGTLALSQIVRCIVHGFKLGVVSPEAMSQRSLRRLDQPVHIKFGNICPPFLFPFLTAILFSPLVPLAGGFASTNFYLNSKVYTHQALFVYTQPYESGGMLMYEMNRFFFIILYAVMLMFNGYLAVSQAYIQSVILLFLSVIMIWATQMSIAKNFIHPSRVQPYTGARLFDKMNARKQAREEEEESLTNDIVNASNAARRLTRSSRVTPMVDMRSFRRMHFSQEKMTPSSLETGGTGITGTTESTSKDPPPNPFEFVARSESLQLEEEQVDSFHYRQPELDKSLWEREPEPYR